MHLEEIHQMIGALTEIIHEIEMHQIATMVTAMEITRKIEIHPTPITVTGINHLVEHQTEITAQTTNIHGVTIIGNISTML